MVFKKVQRFFQYEAIILAGFIVAAGTLVKLFGIYEFSSDWFWFLTGVALIVEGYIALIKQRQFDNKYKIIERKH